MQTFEKGTKTITYKFVWNIPEGPVQVVAILAQPK